MTLNASGAISLGGTVAGQSIELELAESGTVQISMNDAIVRTLAGVASGAISFSVLHGKSSYTPVAVLTQPTAISASGAYGSPSGNGTTGTTTVAGTHGTGTYTYTWTFTGSGTLNGQGTATVSVTSNVGAAATNTGTIYCTISDGTTSINTNTVAWSVQNTSVASSFSISISPSSAGPFTTALPAYSPSTTFTATVVGGTPPFNYIQLTAYNTTPPYLSTSGGYIGSTSTRTTPPATIAFNSDPGTTVVGQLYAYTYDSTATSVSSPFETVTLTNTATSNWVIGASLPTGVIYSAGAGASNNAAIVGAGAYYDTSLGWTDGVAAQSWNGTAWSTLANLSTSRQGLAGFGTQSAAVMAAGIQGYYTGTDLNTVEKWNGTAWSAGTGMTLAREYCSGTGAQTAGLVVGGIQQGGVGYTAPEAYNGTSWTTKPQELNGGATQCALTGTSTSALWAGTYNTAFAQIWNGTSWAFSGTPVKTRNSQGLAGTISSALMYGGVVPQTAGANYSMDYSTELFNGTTWSASTNMKHAVNANAYAGSSATGALAAGGNDFYVTYTWCQHYT